MLGPLLQFPLDLDLLNFESLIVEPVIGYIPYVDNEARMQKPRKQTRVEGKLEDYERECKCGADEQIICGAGDE